MFNVPLPLILPLMVAANGLIERREETGDRRAKTITITGRGRTIINQVEVASREVRAATLGGLSGEEIAIATHVLERVCQNLAKEQDREA